jgi:hypothetical protein
MTNQEFMLHGRTLIYLTSCLFSKKQPDESQLEQEDLQVFYSFCKFHSCTALACYGLEKTETFKKADAELQKKFLNEKNNAIRKNILLEAEIKKCFSWMSENKIWHMPLKGYILKDLYPSIGMRQMSDIDILFDAQGEEALHENMLSLGYSIDGYARSNVDAYLKEPIYNFEFHMTLFGRGHDDIWYAYYENIKDKLIPVSSKPYEYAFTKEDYYIFMLAHAYKHFEGGGTGIRTLIDEYVYLNQYEKELDWHYIHSQLAHLNLVEFEAMLRNLAMHSMKWVTDAEYTLSKQEEELLLDLCSSGTYGTQQKWIKGELEKMASSGEAVTTAMRLKRLYHRAFPSNDWFINNIPECRKHPSLVPLWRIYRFIHGCFTRLKPITSEIYQTMHVNVDSKNVE